jgi:hypothetical protein
MNVDGIKAGCSEGEGHLCVTIHALLSKDRNPRPSDEPLKGSHYGKADISGIELEFVGDARIL